VYASETWRKGRFFDRPFLYKPVADSTNVTSSPELSTSTNKEGKANELPLQKLLSGIHLSHRDFSARLSPARSRANSATESDAAISHTSSGHLIFGNTGHPIALSQAKNGDTVEAEAIQDVKEGHKVLLKKGSMLLGHVYSVEPPNASNPEQVVVIAFDRVKPKKGDAAPCPLVIQALAPRSDVQTDSVDYATGRGIQGATQEALPAGHASATSGSINPLTTKSHGV
jgi:hypothetical protein